MKVRASLPGVPVALSSIPSLPPAALGSNTGIIHFYENPPGLPLNGPTTTGTRCAGLRLGMGREEGGGKGEGRIIRIPADALTLFHGFKSFFDFMGLLPNLSG